MRRYVWGTGWSLGCRIRQLLVARVVRIPAQQQVAIDTGGRKNEDSQGAEKQWKCSAGVGAPMFRRGSGVVPVKDIQGLT
jgi:hypothetical protein